MTTVLPIKRIDANCILMRFEDAARQVHHETYWSRGAARLPKVCAMSGEPIVPGDLVYRPPKHLIYGTLRTLSSVVDAALEGQEQ